MRFRPSSRQRLRLHVVWLALASLVLVGWSDGGGPSVTRSAGQTSATLVYRKLFRLGPSDDYFTDGLVRIARAGKVLYSERLGLYPSLEAGTPVRGDTRSLAVRDLDGDGEPEVLVLLESGGAHCCSWTRVYRYAGGTYAPVSHFWGNTSSSPTLRDVGGDGRVEFLSTDDRFAYDFNGYAGSVRPVRIWAFGRAGFRDVTRLHPALVRADAARLWRFYVHDRRSLPGSARGLLPAWAAEQYLLGDESRANRELENAARRGYLVPAVDGPRDPAAYIAAVKRLLRRTGYTAA